jgi:lysophospholipid acyltransferase (LPLAT)-like uncharacterized protein
MESAQDPRPYSTSERFKASAIGWAGYFAVGIIGKTMRWQSVGDEHLKSILDSGHRAIFTFWHGRIFPSTYFWRNRGIVVMTSQNLDGEGIAQCIQRFGFGVARGSSSKGGLRALAQLVKDIRRGKDAAFTIDGPRGPRYIAKQGPILLGFKTGAAYSLLSYFDETQNPTEELGRVSDSAAVHEGGRAAGGTHLGAAGIQRRRTAGIARKNAKVSGRSAASRRLLVVSGFPHLGEWCKFKRQ